MSVFEEIIPPKGDEDALFCQQVKVAQLRGLLGQKDAILKDIVDQAQPGTAVFYLAARALALQLEDAA